MLAGGLEASGGWLTAADGGGLDGTCVGVEFGAGWLGGAGDADLDGRAAVCPHPAAGPPLQAADPVSRLVVAGPESDPVLSKNVTTSAATAISPALLATSTARRDQRRSGRCALWRATRLTLARYRVNCGWLTHFTASSGDRPWSA